MFYSLLLLQAGEQLVYALSEGLKKIEPGKPLVVVTAKAGTAQDFSRLAGSWGLQANVLKADGNGGSAPSAAFTLAAVSHPYGSVPAELKPWQNPSTAAPSLLPLQLCLEQLLSFFTLGPAERKPWSEILQKQLKRFFFSFLRRRAEEQRRRGEGFVELGFFFFPFCNTSFSGECLVLLMLSGSGSYCGSRSLVIRCYCRRHRSAEPELFIQPSWSSQASRLGRAAHGAAGSRGGVESSLGPQGNPPSLVTVCPGLWDLLGLMGGRA